MQGVLEVVGIEVGKHLGDVQNALPLRSVCKEWREIVTLGAAEASLDLKPCDGHTSTEAQAKDELFFKRCPQLRKLTYHVSPMISLSQFEAAMSQLASRLAQLEQLVLIFNNPGQQLETRHLAALSALPRLTALTLQANFHPESCSFSAVLGGLAGLTALTLLPSEASTGLTDAHVASLAGLSSLASLEFPGHARAFSGATLINLAAGLPQLSRLIITSNKAGSVDYTLTLPALAGLRALTRRPNSSSIPLLLEVGVPDVAFGAALLRAVVGSGLASVSISVREAADSGSIAALTAIPGSAQQLAGLDLEFRAAPTAQDVAALAACSSLKRLHLSCKCPRAPSTALDWTPWLGLSQLEHLHLHINPAWRAPLQPAMLAASAAAWPNLHHLHLRLSPSDNSTHALAQLHSFKSLKSLSLTWLGQAGPAVGSIGARRRSSLDVAALNLAHLPPGLEELNLTSISTVRLTLPPPPPPAGSKAAGTVLPALRSLLLDGNFGVSDELLASLLGHAPQLASLTLVLTGRQTLSGDGLQAALAASASVAAATGGTHGLSSLLLSDYREAPLCLTQASLAGLAAAGLSRIRHLKLSTPDVVHAELQPAVFAGFTKLWRLDLVGCQDKAVAALSGVLPLCCIKPCSEWLGDAPSSPAPAAEAAAAVPAAMEVDGAAA